MLFSRKKTLSESGVLRGMVDRHSHLLPSVDDGFRSQERTLEALAKMEKEGVAELWLTPHIMEDVPNTTSDLKRRFAELCGIYGGSIKLHLAAENMLDNLFLERFDANDLLTQDNNMLLVETSYFNPPLEFEELIGDILGKGYRVLLAHPERYKYMDDKDYDQLKERGVLFQLNLGSLVGIYSKQTQEKAEKLLKKEYYNFMGTDLHAVAQYDKILSTPVRVSVINRLRSIPNQID